MSLTTLGILDATILSFLQVRGRVKDAFKTGRTKPIQFRKQQLLSLAYLIKDNIALFQRALASDLGRPETETIM